MPDITTTQIFTDGEKGITATKMNNIVANSVIQPDFVTAKPSSSTLDPTDQLLEVKGAGTYARITGQQLIDSVSASVTQNITPTIWSVRLRSFNAAGNPTFEVDQRNTNAFLAFPASGTFVQDRWQNVRAGLSTMTYSTQAIGAQNVLVPGTNFCISQAYQKITLSAQQATLAAGDVAMLVQNVEGPAFRELISDVSSVSILATTNVTGGLKFALSLRDPGSTTKSLCKLCTLTTANIWQLITLSNLPVFPSGNFTTVPGNSGYILGICFGAGSTFIPSANDTWQNGNFVGAVGMDNLGTKPVGSYLILAFVQHEPGAQCSTPIDCPFTQNYDACLRYFQKTYFWNVKPGTANATQGMRTQWQPVANANFFSPNSFVKTMAKVPTLTIWDPIAGGINSYSYQGTSATTVTNPLYVGDSGYGGFVSGGAPAAGSWGFWHHTADTGM